MPIRARLIFRTQDGQSGKNAVPANAAGPSAALCQVDSGGTSAHITGPAEWQQRIASGEFKGIAVAAA